MGRRINSSGLVIAGIGFFLTRFTVALAIYEDPIRFYLAGIVPLTLGLGLAAFGVALTVAEIDGRTVRTMATWCVIGAGTMLVLVVLTLVGSSAGDMPTFTTLQSRVYLSNFLIGGSVGGTLTGLYASRNRRHRGELEQQANRLEVLNRLLRHEVLNAVTVIKGYAPVATDDDPEAVELIQARSNDIEATIEEVRYLARSARASHTADVTVDLRARLEASLESVEERHPEASVDLESVPAEFTVRANERLEQVFTGLLEQAVVRSTADPPEVAVEVERSGETVRVRFEHAGPGFEPEQRALLETGDIGEYDDPSSGFDLNIIRLLVESYHGDMETAHDGNRAAVTVVLPRGGSETSGHGLLTSTAAGVRPAVPALVVTLVASLIAGVTYGIASESMGGSVAGIGVFYGTASPIVGWITHEFHSVVFGFVFAGFVSLAPERYQQRYGPHAVIGLAWGLVLWVGAAGFIAPIWLTLIGIPEVGIPTFLPHLLAAHLTWGLTLGLLTPWGYRHATPWLAGQLRSGLQDLTLG